MPDAEHAAGFPPPPAHEAQHAGDAGAAPATAQAHGSDAGKPGNAASGEAPPRGQPRAHAKFKARATTPDMPQRAADRGKSPGGHNRDKDSFDAFMESGRTSPHTVPKSAALRGHPEPRGDHTGGTPLRVSRQAHFQRNYIALGTETEHAAATDDGPATASGAADQAPDEHSAQGSGTRVETGTNAASKPTDQPPGTTPSWGRGHLDYTRSEGDARHPSAHVEQAAAQDLDLVVDRLTTGEQLALALSIRWLLTSRSRHLEEGTRTMADITFNHGAAHTPLATMDHPSQWHYVATRLMARFGAASTDKMNGLHWLWHQRAALRIRTVMQKDNIWAIRGSPGYRERASGHRRPRFEEVPRPPRHAARHNSPGRHQGALPGVGSPSGTYRSPSDSSPRGGTEAALTPQGCRATCQSGTRRQGTLAAPGAAAARRLPQHGESSSKRAWTEAMEVPRTQASNGHRLPPIPNGGPRGPAPSARTSPPFPRQPSELNRQRSTQTPTRQQTVRPARPPPPSQGRRPACCQGNGTPRTHGQGDPRPTNGPNRGWGDKPLNAPPPP